MTQPESDQQPKNQPEQSGQRGRKAHQESRKGRRRERAKEIQGTSPVDSIAEHLREHGGKKRTRRTQGGKHRKKK